MKITSLQIWKVFKSELSTKFNKFVAFRHWIAVWASILLLKAVSLFRNIEAFKLFVFSPMEFI